MGACCQKELECEDKNKEIDIQMDNHNHDDEIKLKIMKWNEDEKIVQQAKNNQSQIKLEIIQVPQGVASIILDDHTQQQKQTKQYINYQMPFLPYLTINQVVNYNKLPYWTQQQIKQLQLYSPPQFISNSGFQFCSIKYLDGQIYEGYMLNNQKNGYGMHLKGDEFYEGYFKWDQRNGWGRCIYLNKEAISGVWENDKINSGIFNSNFN